MPRHQVLGLLQLALMSPFALLLGYMLMAAVRS